MANTDYVGANGSISWVSGLTGGANAPEEDRSCIVSGRLYRPEFVTTRPGSLSQRVALGEYRGEVTITVGVTDDGTPPIPITTTGVLKIFSGGTQALSFRVVVVEVMGFGYNSLTGEAQFQRYRLRLTNTATSDTVTVT